MLELVGRNTAPASTLASLLAIENGDDSILVVTTADQNVEDSAFTLAIQEVIIDGCEESIVILGVKSNLLETGYGYIQLKAGDSILSVY
jgi:mannose-1-phosphate guanylyltransferase / mannose-6-phosphate isomerase